MLFMHNIYIKDDTHNNTKHQDWKHQHYINNNNNIKKRIMMTLITKVTVVLMTMITKIRITVTITAKNSNIKNGNKTATQVTKSHISRQTQ